MAFRIIAGAITISLCTALAACDTNNVRDNQTPRAQLGTLQGQPTPTPTPSH